MGLPLTSFLHEVLSSRLLTTHIQNQNFTDLCQGVRINFWLQAVHRLLRDEQA